MTTTPDTCHWCGAVGNWPDICKNTRDMEDYAIQTVGTERGERCYNVLKEQGIGEKGIAYVDANREFNKGAMQ